MSDDLRLSIGGVASASFPPYLPPSSITMLGDLALRQIPTSVVSAPAGYRGLASPAFGTVFLALTNAHASFDFSAPHRGVMIAGVATSAPSEAEANRLSSGHRAKELEWRRTHRDVLRAYAHQWVVLQGDEIVAHGTDPSQVVGEARARGVTVPYIFRVEADQATVVKIGL